MERARDAKIRSYAESCRCSGWGGKTQIVYHCNLNFHTVMPYLELLIRNGLLQRIDGSVASTGRRRRGADALWHFQEPIGADSRVPGGGERGG